MLKGKKTYITAITAILGAVTAYLSGEIQLFEAIQLGVTALLATFVRSGIKDTEKNVEKVVEQKQNSTPRGKYSRGAGYSYAG